MKILLDTHLLLWAAAPEGSDDRLPAAAAEIIEDESHELLFSVVAIWEVAIKCSLGRPDFRTDPHILRRALIDAGYGEVPVTGLHAATVKNLPPIHRDPFDRLLIAQAITEGVTLLTADQRMAGYGAPVRLV